MGVQNCFRCCTKWVTIPLHIHRLSIQLVIPLYFERGLRVDRVLLDQLALNISLLDSTQLLLAQHAALNGGLVLDSPFLA
jgi:hypothetical protein